MSEETPNMEKIELYVPAPLLEQAKELAQIEGWKLSELFRIFWVQGFGSYSEGSNKRLVNKGLRQKNVGIPSND
jgi:hypothetical protein